MMVSWNIPFAYGGHSTLNIESPLVNLIRQTRNSRDFANLIHFLWLILDTLLGISTSMSHKSIHFFVASF